MTQAYNFSAGPAMLPKEVLLRIQEELIEYENSKASVMEISHRGVDFMEAAQKSEKDLRELLKIPDHYKVLFLQGGASAQFSMVPINLLRGGSKANYANTGHWSLRLLQRQKGIARLMYVQIAQKIILLTLMIFKIGILMKRLLIFITRLTKRLQA